MTFIKPEYFMGKPTDDWLKEDSRSKKKPKGKTSPIVIPSGNYWIIENVFYNGATQDYALRRTLLSSATQDVHAQNRIAKLNNGFYCGSMPLNYAAFKAVYNMPESKEKQEIRKFIQESMRNIFLITSTRILYQPGDKVLDKIIHNYKIPNEEFEKQALIVGTDRVLIQDDANALEALVLTNDVNEVKEILGWINETPDVRIWRLNEKPNTINERVAGFSAYFGGVNFCYNGNLSLENDSLGYAPLGASNGKLTGMQGGAK